ncbi:hypothetical protein [Rickettsia endosymbiont of Pantilius tunicatus]|uniref:hypothetical protein n=1 Tax=unclassified Rickettsia TaxID=114295 RepID=UPI00376F036A
MNTKRFLQQQMKNFAEESIKKIINAAKEKEYFLSPFKHLVIDNFLSLELAKSCLDDFPNPKEKQWDIANDKDIEIKKRSTWKSEFDIPDGIVDTIRLFNSSDMLYALVGLFKIPKLIPDPLNFPEGEYHKSIILYY